MAANTSSNQLKYPLSAHHNDAKPSYGGRDVVGYGGKPPKGKKYRYFSHHIYFCLSSSCFSLLLLLSIYHHINFSLTPLNHVFGHILYTFHHHSLLA